VSVNIRSLYCYQGSDFGDHNWPIISRSHRGCLYFLWDRGQAPKSKGKKFGWTDKSSNKEVIS